MKISIKFILILVLTFTTANCYCQYTNNASKEIVRFTREIEKSIKKYSIVSNQIDWTQFTRNLDTIVFTDNEELDKRKIIKQYRVALRDQGDMHSFFRTPTQIQNRKNRDSATIFSTSRYLGENIGYIQLPAFSSYNQETIRKYANTIRNQIQELDTTYIIKSWIVDLRNNGGGNMWPMLAGINSLQDDGVTGYFLSNKKIKSAWNIRNGKINYTNLTISNYKVNQKNPKIAVLVNKNTGSSGEMTAISLIGLPNIKTIGQPTAGYTTVNSRIYLKDGTELYLATGYCADRNKKKYIGKIIPDEIISDEDSQKEDLTLAAAMKWLQKKL